MATMLRYFRCGLFALLLFSIPIMISAQSNYAIEFDGVDDCVEFDVDMQYYASPGCTWEMWFYRKDITKPIQVLLAFWDNHGYEDIWFGWGVRGSGNTLEFGIDGSGGVANRMLPYPEFEPPGGWKTDTWYHVAAVRDFISDSAKLYIDGALVSEIEFAGVPIPRNCCTKSGIGYFNRDCGNLHGYFNGIIDEVRIWNCARTQDEILTNLYTQFAGSEPGLVGYWPFEEGVGTQTADRTTGVNHGILLNGAKWVQSSIIPPFPPVAPSSLQASAISPTKVRLAWSDNSNNETRFVIEYRVGSGSWIKLDSTSANKTNLIVMNLQPCTAYDFRMMAVNPYFISNYSNSASATTPDFKGPTELEAKPVSYQSILLQWKDNSPYETGHVVELSRDGMAWVIADSCDRDEQSHNIDGLLATTNYTFRVKAIEDLVSSPYSNEATASTLIFLEAPTKLIATANSETEVALLWLDNSSDESGFEIEQRIGSGNWLLIHTTDRNEAQQVFTGLTPRSEYFYRVRAVGDDAASSYSNIAHVITRLPPKTPEEFHAEALTHNVVHLEWERGSVNEDNFQIERKTLSGDWMIVHTVAAGTTEINDEGLQAETTYWYRIRATNEVSVSDWADEEEVTTHKLPVPDAPFGLMAAATGPNSIGLSWVMPDPCYEEGFELEESLTGNDTDFTTVSPSPVGGSRTYARKGLKPETTYYYRLRAINSSGVSAYSGIAHATTLRKDEKIPVAPFSVIASALSESKIRVSWSMPDSCLAEGFSIERSLSGQIDDFQLLDDALPRIARMYIDSLLWPETTYYYRLKAYNVHGTSEYSHIVSATTSKEPLSPELIAAMDLKEQLIPGLERLFCESDEDLQALRDLLGSYPLGYNETAARSVMSDWRSKQPSGVGTAVEAMHRYALVEQAMRDVLGLDIKEPPLPGAFSIAHHAVLAPSVCVKDLLALSIAWNNERALVKESDRRCLDGIMADLSYALFDGASTLFLLTESRQNASLASLYALLLMKTGDLATVTPARLLSVTNYYQEATLALHYIPATQHVIDDFADVTKGRLFRGSYQNAEVKYNNLLVDVESITSDMGVEFLAHKTICQGLDRAYSIYTTESPAFSAFARKLTVLKPELCKAISRSIADAATPVASQLYLQGTDGIGGRISLPSALEKAATEIFDPISSTPRQAETGLFRRSAGSMSTFDRSVLDEDRNALLSLRKEVLDGNTAYVANEFEALRRLGKRSIAALGLWQRWISGVPASDLLAVETRAEKYYLAMASLHRAKSQRSVLSVSLADFMLDLQEYKTTPLVAEIDSIIGWMYKAADVAEAELSEIQDLITAPILALDHVSVEGKPQEGPKRYRLTVGIRNYGYIDALETQTIVYVLEGSARFVSLNTIDLEDVPQQTSEQHTLDLDIEPLTKFLTISATMTIKGGMSYTDIRTLPVPDISTGITDTPVPDEISLEANYPNPFNPRTRIEFTLPRAMNISLTITDALGRLVARPITNTIRGRGFHAIDFDGAGLPSGVYLYKIETDGIVLARRMVLLK